MTDRLRRLAAAFGAALVVGAVSPAAAHPHGWIDVWSTVLFDESGQPSAIREVWLFDEYYSAFAVEGLDEDGDGEPDRAGLAALLQENMTNLEAYDYFTRIESDGVPVPIGPATEMSSQMHGDRLQMTFVVPFAQQDLAPGDAFTYAVFDPTYYIAMLHADAADAVRLEGAPEGCTHQLAEPRPDPEAVALASMLDQTQSGGDGLGAQFAETVTIRCAAR
jgi:ABC-type uncharacterized transport system substrate-binding protein